MSREVIVLGMDGEQGSYLLLTVSQFQSHVSKNQKHAGFIREGKMVSSNKDEPLTEQEQRTMLAMHSVLLLTMWQLFPSH